MQTRPDALTERRAILPSGTPPSPREAGALAWTDIVRLNLDPLPETFEVLFLHHAGANPELSRRVAALLAAPVPPSPAMLGAIRGECAGPTPESAALDDASAEILSTAESVGARLAEEGRATIAYADALADCSAHIHTNGPAPAAAGGAGGGLLRAVEILSAETARACERNRKLERELSAAAGRVRTLQTKLEEAREAVARDALTGIASRRAFDAALRRAVTAARGNGTALSLLMLDIDHFKRFNDTYGHQTGDLVLRLVGRILTDSVKGRDTAARYGGEEFAVLLVGADDRAAVAVAQQILDTLASQRLSRRGARDLGHITGSVGAATLREGEGAAALVERADKALYKAKLLGRNRVCFEGEQSLVGA